MTADHAFTSDLTVDEHHAIRSVGFSPVGQVMGSCVYHIAYRGSRNCGYTGWTVVHNNQSPYSGRNRFTGGLATATEAADLSASLYEARKLAMKRMRQECSGLGGDGVVAVRLTIAPFPAGGLEFRAIGTAVRADGPVRPRRPFLSDLTGQDFAKLVTAGWVPCGLVLGLAVAVRHDDDRTRMQAGMSRRNTEIGGFTELVDSARRWARDRLRKDCARTGGTGVVVRTTTLQVSERSCASARLDRDHLAEAMVTGTAITPFRHANGNAPPAPLPIMRLR